MKRFLLITICSLLSAKFGIAQNCDPTTPVFNVDLTAQPNGTWISPASARHGKCCGINNGPDECIQFNLTLDTSATAINFDIYSGAVPGGSMFYQVNCGPMQAVGQPLCLTGPGPFVITFCKPGNNSNRYAITSIYEPALNGLRYVSQSCIGNLVATGLVQSTIQWTSVPNNSTYNNYLSCSSGCDSVSVIPPPGFSGYIDYQVCGTVAGGCSVLPFCDTLRVNFVNDLNVNITPVNPTICFGASNITVTANGTGGLPPYHYQWDSGDTTAALNVGPGTYRVIIKDQMNCSIDSDIVVVNALANPISCNAGTDGTLCLNNSAYQLNGNVIAANGGKWSGSGSFVPNATTLNAEYYPSNLEITNGFTDLQLITTGNFNCPADTDYVHLVISANPLPNINGPLQGCIYETTHYTAPYVSGNTYQWNVTGGNITSQNLNSVDIQWNASGNNQLSLLESNISGCDSLVSIDVLISPKPGPVITGAITVCDNSSEIYSVLQPVSGNTYQWSVTNGVINNNGISPITVNWNSIGIGNILVTETNSYGCDSSISIYVSVMPQPAPVITGNKIVCNNSIETYSTIYTNNNQYIWNVTNGLILSQNNNSISVQWTDTGNGVITMTEISPSFCDSTVSFNVQILSQPTPVINGQQLICSRAIINYGVSGVNSNELIRWLINGGTFIGSDSSESVDVLWLNAGYGELRVQVISPSGCDSVVTYPVTILEGVQPEMKGPPRVCQNDSSVYTVANVQGHTYLWQVNGGLVLSSVGNRLAVWWQTVGRGEIHVTETSPAGCDSTIALSVVIDSLPNVAANGIPAVCQNEPSTFYAATIANNSYAWTLSGGNINGSSTQPAVTCQWSQPGQYTVNLLQTNQYGCFAQAAILVQVMPVPSINLTGNTSGCMNSNSTFHLSNSAGVSYAYSVTGGVINSQVNGTVDVSWTTSGLHTFSVNAVNNQTGCTSQNSLDINVSALPVPVVSANAYAGCAPFEISFTGNASNNNYNYSWSFGEGNLAFGANPVHAFNSSGTYPVQVIISNNSGCSDTANGIVNVYPTPITDFEVLNGNRFYADYEEVQLVNQSKGGNAWQWNLGNGSASNSFDPSAMIYHEPGFYNITLESMNVYGCKSTVTRQIEIIVPENIFIPNSFTPNGDSKNDYFSVAFHNIEKAHISIFNRWGELIYDTDDMDFRWDGKYNDRNIENDIYVYTVDAVGYYGDVIRKVGKLCVMY